MFQCKNIIEVQTCIHPGNICNGNQDCFYGDDELNCELKSVKCPLNCICLLLAIACTNTFSVNVLTDLKPIYLSVYMSNSNICTLKYLQKLVNVKIIKLPGNNLECICTSHSFTQILLLDLGYNCIKQVGKKCFVSFYSLQSLNINDNCIAFTEVGSFYNLSNLKYINLSNNTLSNIPKCNLNDSIEIKLFYIINVSLIDIDTLALHELKVNVIITFDYHLCCTSSKETICLAHMPWYISCSDILPRNYFKLLFISVSCLVTLLNIISIILHFFTSKYLQSFAIIVISINFNDLLCAIYLGCVWISDVVFKNEFQVKEKMWRSGPVCFTAFRILLWFTILTQFVLIFLSVSRLMLVVYPIDTKFKETKFVLKSVSLIYILSLFATFLLTLSFKVTHEILPISLCLPFIDPTNLFIMIKVITCIIILTQTVTSIIIATMHIILIYELKQYQKQIIKSKSDAALVVQLIIITESNFICWFPANGIYVAAMFLSIYPIDLIV